MFDSFFLGGFECATGFNREGQWIDLVADTGHDHHAEADYRRLRAVGIRAARDAIRWPLVDRGGGRYDFASAEPVVAAARRQGVTVIWDLFHYGYPVGLDLLSPAFAERFADYCAACGRFLRERLPGPLWFTPVNEPSFFAWAAGHDAQFAPHRRGQATDLKIALVRAALRGVEALRAELPDARFVHADPLCRVVTPGRGAGEASPGQPQAERTAGTEHPDAAQDQAVRDFNERHVFEAWDMLAGRLHPELGGSRAHLDVVGINYYWTCQWELGHRQRWLRDEDPRRLPLHRLLRQVWERYGGELLITETMHWGEGRADWFEGLLREIRLALDAGIALRGVCLYPVMNMPDWHAPREWIRMGLWDLETGGDGAPGRRVPHRPLVDRLPQAQDEVRRWMDEAARQTGT